MLVNYEPTDLDLYQVVVDGTSLTGGKHYYLCTDLDGALPDYNLDVPHYPNSTWNQTSKPFGNTRVFIYVTGAVVL